MTKVIALSFAALALYVAIESVSDLVGRSEPEASMVGVALAAISLMLMPAPARARARLVPVIGSAAVVAAARQANLCGLLSAVVPFGVGANGALGWRWADPLARLAIAVIAGTQAIRTHRADSLEDTRCA